MTRSSPAWSRFGSLYPASRASVRLQDRRQQWASLPSRGRRNRPYRRCREYRTRPAETLDHLLGEGISLLQENHEISLRDGFRRAIDPMPEFVRYRRGRNSVVFQHAGFESYGTFISSTEQYAAWLGAAVKDEPRFTAPGDMTRPRRRNRPASSMLIAPAVTEEDDLLPHAAKRRSHLDQSRYFGEAIEMRKADDLSRRHNRSHNPDSFSYIAAIQAHRVPFHLPVLDQVSCGRAQR